jgi:hypothetical protein
LLAAFPQGSQEADRQKLAKICGRAGREEAEAILADPGKSLRGAERQDSGGFGVRERSVRDMIYKVTTTNNYHLLTNNAITLKIIT